jgi:hypothetical protein
MEGKLFLRYRCLPRVPVFAHRCLKAIRVIANIDFPLQKKSQLSSLTMGKLCGASDSIFAQSARPRPVLIGTHVLIRAFVALWDRNFFLSSSADSTIDLVCARPGLPVTMLLELSSVSLTCGWSPLGLQLMLSIASIVGRPRHHG